MEQSLIAWMIGGGERAESPEEQRQRTHRLALHMASGAEPSRPSLRDLVARWTSRPSATSSAALAPDCCVA